jgi:hypothetical protein
MLLIVVFVVFSRNFWPVCKAILQNSKVEPMANQYLLKAKAPYMGLFA